ncbi:MAG TPA: PAS domain S-box protein [Thermoleophilaceae bacterium]|nr:PAS domain S-box protein [Thermoleophilaceae bacterium]
MLPLVTPSNEQLFEVLRESPTGMAVVRATEPEQGRILMVNEALCELLRYSEEELLRRTFQDISHPDDLPHEMELYEQLVSGAVHTYGMEKRLIASDGEARWIRLHVSLLRDEQGGPLYSVGQAIDITELKRALASQAALIDSALDSIVGMDAEGRITEFNPAAERTFGYSKAVALGRPLAELIIPASDRAAHAAGLQRVVKGGEERIIGKRVELTALRADGREVPVELTITRTQEDPPAFTGFIRDLTERWSAAQALEESERRYRRIAETAAEGIWMLDADHRTSFVNPRAAEMLGLRPQDMEGKHPFEFMDAEGREVMRKALDQRREGVRDAYQAKLIHRDGREVWIWTSASPLHQDDGTYAGVLWMVSDVTESVQAAREREELQSQLHQSQRLETVGKLAGGVAHDFNNLLSVILNYAAFLQGELADNPEAVEGLAEIRRAAEGGAALTGRLLAFSRRDVGRPVTLDLRRVVGDVRRMLERTLGAAIELEIRAPEELPPVNVDLHQLEQVLLNLAVNARDAMPDGGRLTIELRVDDGGFVCMEVSDTGCGMDGEVAARAFEPFFTTKPSGAGTGLGLAMVFGIVTKAGGQVTLRSEIDQGTAVTVMLPAADAAEEEGGDGEGPAPRPANGQFVLVVDDEDSVRKVAGRVLERHGYRVVEAAGGEEAQALFPQLDPKPDLLLTDVAMPKVSGLELAEALEANGDGRLPVVFMSGYSGGSVPSPEELERGSSFLQKPFTPESLLHVVGEALAPETRAAV